MKQRIIVQAIIRDKNRVLLLHRALGPLNVVGKYELPGGTLEGNEQPDDGIKRHIHNDIDIDVQKVTLKDVMSLPNHDAQDIFIVYEVVGISKALRLKISHNYDMYSWMQLSEIHQNQLRDSAYYLLCSQNSPTALSATASLASDTVELKASNGNSLDIVSSSYVDKNTSDLTEVNFSSLKSSRDVKKPSVSGKLTTVKVEKNTSKFIMYSDGGSRGNPGPSAAAFVIYDNEVLVDQGGEYLGITTNNQAEYHGVLFGLERAVERHIKILQCRIDSMLVVNQLNGLYKIKNRELWPVNERVRSILSKFDHIQFRHIPRELNVVADALVNKLLDEHENDTD